MGGHRQDDHGRGARPSRSSGTRRTLIWSKDVNGVGNEYYDALRLRVHLAEVADEASAPARRVARPAGRGRRTHRNGRLHRPPTDMVSLPAPGHHAITFVIFYVLPSADPARMRAGKQRRRGVDRGDPPPAGLDEPLTTQFYDYVKRLVLHGDFGNSYGNDEPVRELIFDRLPNTIWLVLGAAFLWFADRRHDRGDLRRRDAGTVSDRAAMGSALLLISAPVYWLGLVAIYLFASDIGKFPLLPGNGAYADAHGFFGHVHVLIMPWFVLAAAFAAIYARLVRSNMLEVMSEDYIRTARAKGLQRADRDHQARAARGDHARHHRARTRHRDPDGRRDPDRDGVRDSRRRAPVLRRDHPR